MPGPREMITVTERRFPVRIRLWRAARRPRPALLRDDSLAGPESRRGWLDRQAFGVRGVLKDAISIILRMPRSPVPLSRGGARGQGRRLSAGCFKCERMGPRRGSLRGCTALLRPTFGLPTPVSALRSD